MQLTEIALTSGSWGAAPPDEETQIAVVNALAEFAVQAGIDLRVEMYVARVAHLGALEELFRLRDNSAPVDAVIRLEARSDQFFLAKDLGAKEVVFDVPASEIVAAKRFMPGGIKRAAEYAAEQAEMAVLQGLVPEIALVDITRAQGRQLEPLIQNVIEALRPHGVRPQWRLVDSLGLGNPFAGARRPHSLPGWIRWMDKHCRIDPEEIRVQCSDIMGLALANTLASAQAGALPASSLFGLGHHAGWSATEQMMIHLCDPWPNLIGINKLKPLLDKDGQRRDLYRPISGELAFTMPGGTSPEKMDDRIPQYLPFDPEKVSGVSPEPCLEPLSGFAGLLHLIHRHNPEYHIDTEDPEARAISQELEDQFEEGRAIPATWAEIEPLIAKTGIMSRAVKGDNGEK